MIKGFLVLILFIILTFPGFKNLIMPGLIDGHDIEGHLVRLVEFDQSLSQGNFPVRWAGRLNFGLGYPFFVFDYPLAYYFTDFIHILGLNYVDSMKLIFIISFPLSGFFAFIWLKSHFSKTAALVAGLFFTMIPYHFLNVYVRGALAEIIGLTFVPLNFYLIDRLINKPTTLNSLYLSLGLFVSITSHNITALIYCSIWFIYALVRIFSLKIPFKNQLRSEQFKKIIFGFLGSIFISAFFIIPALYFTFISRITKAGFLLTNYYKESFPSLKSLIYSPWGYNGAKAGIEKGEMSLQIGVIHEILIITAIVLLIFLILKNKLQGKHLIIYFTLLMLIALFLMQEISLPIWELIIPLQFLEFPWRLLSVVAISASFMIAFLLDRLSYFNKSYKFKIVISLCLVLALFYADRNIMRADKHYDWVNPIKFGVYPGTSDLVSEHLPKWHSRDEELLPYSPFKVLDGEASIVAEDRKTNLHIFQITVKQKATIVDRTDYFPGWIVYANGQKVSLVDPNSSRSRGLIAFELNPGKYKIASKLQEDPVEMFADSLSIISLLCFLFFILRERFKLAN